MSSLQVAVSSSRISPISTRVGAGLQRAQQSSLYPPERGEVLTWMQRPSPC